MLMYVSTDVVKECPGFMYSCEDGACVPMRDECDGYPDCPDGSDEGPVCSAFPCPADRPYR